MSTQMNAKEDAMENSRNPESSTALETLRNRIEAIEENLKGLPELAGSLPEKGIQKFILGLIKSTDLTLSIMKRAIDISISQQYLHEHASNASRSNKI